MVSENRWGRIAGGVLTTAMLAPALLSLGQSGWDAYRSKQNLRPDLVPDSALVFQSRSDTLDFDCVDIYNQVSVEDLRAGAQPSYDVIVARHHRQGEVVLRLADVDGTEEEKRAYIIGSMICLDAVAEAFGHK